MWLYVSLAASVIGGLAQPFCSRVQSTGLWVGKVLVPAETATAYPRGLQDAVTEGWPSWVGFGSAVFIFAAVGIGFLHAWWTPVLAVPTFAVVTALADRIPSTPVALEWYLARLCEHANRRAANFSVSGDVRRAQAAEDLASSLDAILEIYIGTGVHAPSMREARRAPFGKPDYLLRRIT
jgi:hypothetical protein